MANVSETQAFIDELAAPSLHTNAALRTWMKASATVVRERGQQIALLRGMIQEAEGEEPNVEVAGKMEGLIQQLDAQARILGNIAREGRGIRTSLGLFAGQVTEFRALASAAGYTVP